MGQRAMHACHVSMRPIISSAGSSWGLKFISADWIFSLFVESVYGDDVVLILLIVTSDHDVFGGFRSNTSQEKEFICS